MRFSWTKTTLFSQFFAGGVKVKRVLRVLGEGEWGIQAGSWEVLGGVRGGS